MPPQNFERGKRWDIFSEFDFMQRGRDISERARYSALKYPPKNAVSWDMETEFVPQRRHITSPLGSPDG
jgi:hypothetical protein